MARGGYSRRAGYLTVPPVRSDPLPSSESISASSGRWRAFELRSRAVPGDAERRMQAALSEPTCPICLVQRGAEARWLRHFLDEGYQAAEVLGRIVDTVGFCAGHAASLYTLETHGAAIAHVHIAILDRVIERLARMQRAHHLIPRGTRSISSRAAPGCPLCARQAEIARGHVAGLAAALRRAGGRRYGDPAMLCVPHLRLSADRVDAATLRTVASAHTNYLERPVPADDARSEASRRRIADLLGAPPGTVAELEAEEADPYMRIRDPVARLRARLGDETECVLCAELRHVQTAWLDWLRLNAAAGTLDEDVMPACSTHVWLAFDRGGPALRRQLAERATHRESMRFKHVRRSWDDEPDSAPRRLARVWSRQGAPRPIRAHMSARPRCALCDHLETVRRRSLELLGILLRETDARQALERGLGLCARHALPAVAALGKDRSRVLAAALRVKYQIMVWELNEMLRKSAWTARPEPEGSERSSWRRAVALVCGPMA